MLTSHCPLDNSSICELINYHYVLQYKAQFKLTYYYN